MKIRTGILCLGLTLAFCHAAYCQEAETAPTVTAIEVTGNQSISSNTVISKMKTRVGSPYQENVISDDLKRLYLLGYFSDIKIDTEEYKEGVKVIVHVEERPIIETITFSGLRRLRMKDEKLKELLQTKEGKHLDYPSLNDDVNTLSELYEKKGYSQAQIEYKVDINPQTQSATVHFDVVEGKRLRIKNIYVKGNLNVTDKRILKLMKTRRAWLFNRGVYREEVFQEDIERVRAFYHNNGFIDARVDHEIKKDPEKPFLYITLTVEEGKRYLVGSVALLGNSDIVEADILDVIKECVPGAVYSEEALQKDLLAIQGLYFDRGYISAQVQEAVSLNADTGRVDIVYNIIENDITYVNKIKIRGNVKTKDIVVRRELRIRPADRFSGEKLRRSKERLANLGFFEEVSFDTEDTDSPDQKDLIVDVREAKTGAFSFGGGYSTVDQFVGFIEVEQKNFDWKNFPYFTGDGQDLRFRASFGSLSDGVELSFTEPWLFDYPVSFGFDGYKRSHERESDVGYGYDEEITGGDIRLGKEISEYVRASAMYRYDIIEITNITENATQDLKQEEGKNNISSLQLGMTFDNRDSVFDPTRGNIFSGTLEGAGGPFGGDKDFYKFFGRFSHYIPFPRNSSLEFRLRIGATEAYGDSDTVPIYERFFAGGAYTIRGYEERSVGPIDPVSEDPLGGEAMIIGNMEYTYPLFDFLKAAAFFDTGNVWSKLNDIGTGQFKSSFGLGLRVKTPIGPIRLDYGIPLNKVSGEEDKSSGRFHFSMSHGF